MLASTIRLPGTAPVAQWAQTIKGSALRDMLALVTRPNLISFALGLPAAELFPLEACRKAAAQVLATDPEALQYHVPSESLKRHVRELLASRGIDCREEQIFLTSGAQQATHLLVNLLLNHGQEVLVEEVTYEGLHSALLPLRPRVLSVPTDPKTGMDIDSIEAQLARGARPPFIYAITDGHNPLGLSLSQESRNRLVEISRRFRVPIIEDDVFGFLNYDSPTPPMRTLDDEWVFYVGSFSKILAPALRVGWIVVPEQFKPALSFLKHASDLDITTLSQFTLSAYLDAGHLPGHLATLRKEYGLRRDCMLQALESHFPQEAEWTKPGSGMFIWVELPSEIDTAELLRVAVEAEEVAFMPGSIFGFAGARCSRNGMRLNFTNCQPEQIEEGVARLGRVLRSSLRRPRPS
jgi:2-aminoadipate transaminase